MLELSMTVSSILQFEYVIEFLIMLGKVRILRFS